jgi:carbon monoxide dehydrogenase subunit G
MKRFLTTGLPLLLAGALIAGAATDSPVAAARSTLEQWVQTRQLISKTRSDWQADKELLEQSVRMFERELQNLAEQLAAVSTNRTRVDEEREAALAQQAALNAALERARELAGSLEQRVVALAPALPPPLQEKIQPLLNRIPAATAASRVGPVERLQNVVGLLNEVDKFNAAVTVVSEVQKKSDGAEVQVEVLYVGLAQAYFVDKSGQYAGVGRPSPSGWQWSERPELAGRIRQALAVYQNTTPAAFVALPVHIQ